jgi:hypothetical protein
LKNGNGYKFQTEKPSFREDGKEAALMYSILNFTHEIVYDFNLRDFSPSTVWTSPITILPIRRFKIASSNSVIDAHSRISEMNFRTSLSLLAERLWYP